MGFNNAARRTERPRSVRRRRGRAQLHARSRTPWREHVRRQPLDPRARGTSGCAPARAHDTHRGGDGCGTTPARAAAAALDEIEAALTEVGRLREKPAGTIRLIAPSVAIAMTVSPKLAKFTRDYPDVVLDITTEDDSRRDLIAARFDAGIHLGEFLQKDMVAVKVSAEQRAAIVAAPSYFDSHPKPKTPRDLTAHRCIRYRMGAGGPVYRWEFEKRGKPVTVSVSGPSIFNDVDLTLRAALDGVGLAFALEEHVAERIARGELVRVLEDWCPPFDGFFLYYPSRRQQPAALQALVDALRV